jgi:hypothetical protein
MGESAEDKNPTNSRALVQDATLRIRADRESLMADGSRRKREESN